MIRGMFRMMSRRHLSPIITYLNEIENLRLKRILDVALSLAALVVLSPVLLLALLVPLDSPWSIFYAYRRVGKDRRPFTFYKLCTMRLLAAYAPNDLPTDAARLTRLGRWLRRYYLDEVPQLLNVLKGEMSLIGPRPRLVGALAASDPLWRQALTVTPGISGLEQVTLGHSPTRDAQALRLDLRYVRQRSLALDLRLLWRTLRISLSANGYSPRE